jgi:hypothetical protein
MHVNRCRVTEKYCEHIPERVILVHVKGTIITWDVPVITYQAVLANRPNVVLCDKKNLLTDQYSHNLFQIVSQVGMIIECTVEGAIL